MRFDRGTNHRSQVKHPEMEAIVVSDGTARLVSGEVVKLGAGGRRLLAKMPLHAITSVHGEAGLRERLLLETARFSAADHARAENALALASRLHAQPESTAQLLARHLGPIQRRQRRYSRVAIRSGTPSSVFPRIS